MAKFKLKDKNHKLANYNFIKISPDWAEDEYCVDPMEVKGKSGKLLWQERLEECKKTNPSITFEDMCWGVADIPDEFIIKDKGKNKFQ